jgi:hypothetical protein
MAAGTLSINSNTDNSIKLHFSDSTVTPAININITGWTVYFTVKKLTTDLDAAAVINQAITIHSDPVNGVTYAAISALQSTITPGVYYYDLKAVDNLGKKRSSGIGTFIVNDVVRDN